MATQRHTDDRQRTDATTDDLHALGHVERLLRADTRALDVDVRVGGNGHARLTWDTLRVNSHARGSLLASVVNELAATDAWGVSTIHDPHRHDDGRMESMLTVLNVDEEDR